MLPPSQTGAYVCRRCQSSVTARRSLAGALQNVRFLSQTSRRRADRPSSPAAKKKSERKIYPHGRLRGKKGGEVRESSELLPVNSLGKPAENILLRDAELDRSKEEEERDNEMPKDPPVTKVSSKNAIMRAVAQGHATTDSTPTSRSIEDLRDSVLGRKLEKGEFITEKEHRKLSKALSDGFTTTQLRQYATQKGANLLKRTTKQVTNLPHSDWRAGVSAIDERHLIVTGDVGRRHISKEKLARTVIERGWQLHIGDATQIGEIDVYDAQSFAQARNEYGWSAHEFWKISANVTSGTLILDEIAQARQVKMHALTDKVVRITGDKESAMAALMDISQKCMSVLSESLRLISVTSSQPAANSGPKTAPQTKQPATASTFTSLAARKSLLASDLTVLKATTGVIAKIIPSAQGGQVGFSEQNRA